MTVHGSDVVELLSNESPQMEAQCTISVLQRIKFVLDITSILHLVKTIYVTTYAEYCLIFAKSFLLHQVTASIKILLMRCVIGLIQTCMLNLNKNERPGMISMYCCLRSATRDISVSCTNTLRELMSLYGRVTILLCRSIFLSPSRAYRI